MCISDAWGEGSGGAHHTPSIHWNFPIRETFRSTILLAGNMHAGASRGKMTHEREKGGEGESEAAARLPGGGVVAS